MDVYLGQPPATADPVKDSETGRIKEILHQILKVRWDKAKDIGARGAVLMRERADIQELLNLSEQLSGLQPGTLESLCGKQLAEQITADRRRLEHCLEKYDQAIRANTAMYERFQRKTINLSVIGKIGAGKSKFLQTVSGLGNECIPSLMGASCTGVTSIIENITDGSTRALITFKTEQEVMDNLIQEARSLAERIGALVADGAEPVEIGPLTSLDEAQITLVFDQLQERAQQLYQGGNKVAQNYKTEAKALKEAYTIHRKEWYPLLSGAAGYSASAYDPDLEQLGGGDGNPVYRLDKPERIQEYVSKHNYFRYIAVKRVVVQTGLQDLEGEIRLVDTVGIGDTSADTRSRLEDAIRNESDGVIILMKARERVENDESIAQEDIDFLNELKGILREHWDKRPGLWMSFLLNNATGDKKALQPFAEKYLEWMAGAYGANDDLFGVNGIRLRSVVDVADGPAVRENVRSFLEYISRNLTQIDDVLEKDTLRLIGAVREEKARLRRQLRGWTEGIAVSQQDLNYTQILMEERIDRLEYELSQYISRIRSREETAEKSGGSFLRQRLSMVERLMHGEMLPEPPAALSDIIAQACKTYPADFAQARLAAIRRLPEVVRRIAVMPSQEQKELEQSYKADVAGILVHSLGLDLSRLGEHGEPAPDTADPHVFRALAALLLTNVGKSSEIRDAFLSLDQFRLNEMNGVTKVLFIHHASQHLVERPYLQKKPEEPSKIQSAKALILEQSGKFHRSAEDDEANTCVTPGNEKRLLQELQGKLQEFVLAVQDSVGTETYLVSYYDQMLEELYHFMQVLTPEFESRWLLIFHDLKERGLLLEDEQVRKSHELLKQAALQLEAYFGRAQDGEPVGTEN